MAMKRTIRRVRSVWAELGYAQRRLFEIRTGIPVTIRTGIPVTGRDARPPITVEELETLHERGQPPVAA